MKSDARKRNYADASFRMVILTVRPLTLGTWTASDSLTKRSAGDSTAQHENTRTVVVRGDNGCVEPRDRRNEPMEAGDWRDHTATRHVRLW